MSSTIKILPDNVINRIAAGEVVERPASVVKELVENSIDSGATEVVVEVEQAGSRLIRIIDNGSGMAADDARIAFERHATSKIRTDADLEAIQSMGFRGEALSSIASVAHVKMLTAVRGAASGTLIEIEGGSVKTVAEAAAPPGTSLEVGHLFFNTPARLKFLKSPATEFSQIVTALSRQAMAHPSIRFKLTHNKKTVLNLPPSQALRERVFQLYGSEIAGNLVEIAGERDPVHIEALLGRPGYSRGDKTFQDFYVNRRPVRNASLSHALYAACGDMLMRDRHPAAFIFLTVDPQFVDVNVHPAKAEVRFRNQSQVHDLVRDILREGLRGAGGAGIGIRAAAESRSDRIKEVVSDYLQSSEFVVRSSGSEAPSTENDTQQQFSSQDHQTGSLHFLGTPSELRIPRSELLFPLAQVHDSFIIAQSGEGMAIIDQHAAHERVLFEKLQDQHQAGNIAQQNLLIPVQLEVGHAEAGLLAEVLPRLQELGFAVEDFGSGTFVIKAVPSLLVGGDYKRLLLDILDEINAHGQSRALDAIVNDILSVMACHPAIKVHRRLERVEMEQLLSDLFKCRMPFTCPHGRPTVVGFSLREINKMFKRI